MSALRKSTKSALSSLKAKVEEEENNPVVALQSFQIDFDWAIFDEVIFIIFSFLLFLPLFSLVSVWMPGLNSSVVL